MLATSHINPFLTWLFVRKCYKLSDLHYLRFKVDPFYWRFRRWALKARSVLCCSGAPQQLPPRPSPSDLPPLWAADFRGGARVRRTASWPRVLVQPRGGDLVPRPAMPHRGLALLLALLAGTSWAEPIDHEEGKSTHCQYAVMSDSLCATASRR